MFSVTMTSISCGSNETAQNANSTNVSTTNSANAAAPEAPVQAVKFSDADLDEILAPIALYPDPLLAQMLPAATFVDQLTEAQRTLNGKSDDNLIANQNWDVSVKSVAHYPPVLKTMTDDLDWTTTLGQAYISQPSDISKSIQRLRFEASDAGNLKTTPQQAVIEKDNIITIEPAQPQVIYVPEYNPETVYVEQAPPPTEGISTGEAVAIGAIAFTAGLAIGAWLNRDYDYYGYYGPPGVYYHGWNGGGWIGVNRSYVDVDINRNVYINNSYSNINVNRNVYNRNVTNYRTNVTQRANVRTQRATNARVNRQLNRQPGRDLNQGDLNRQPGRDLNQGGFDRQQGRDLNRPETQRKSGWGNGGSGSADRNREMSSGRGGNQHRDLGGDKNQGRPQMERQNSAPRQTQRSAPQQQQRSAPSRSGGGGRRRG